MMPANDTHTACITGASSGIGAAFARELASRGYDLVLVARRATKLAQLAADLQAAFRVNVELLVADLSQRAGVERVAARIAELPTLDLLVNNAGFGVPGIFADVSLDKTLAMIDVHVVASTLLARAVLPGMIAHGRGGLINVSSIGAFVPRPQDAVYCATKAYLVAFSQALQGELSDTGVRVQVLCPGFVPTEFLDQPEYEQLQVKARIPKWLWTSAEEVVQESLRALVRGHVVCIPGLKNRVIVMLARIGLVDVLLRVLAKKLRGSPEISARKVSLPAAGQLGIRVKKP